MHSEQFVSYLSWIDITSLAIIAAFGLMGLFRGLVWQVSRLVSIVVGYVAAVRYAEPVATKLAEWFSIEQRSVAVYVAYVAIFLTVLIVLSVLTGLLRNMLKKTGLSFVDRMGGWLFGLVTGGAVIIIALTILFAFAPDGDLVREVKASHSATYAGKVVNKFDQYLPEDIRRLFADWPNVPASKRASAPMPTRPAYDSHKTGATRESAPKGRLDQNSRKR